MGRDPDFDRNPILQGAQLFELLGFLEFALGQLHELQQELAPKRIDPEVLVEVRQLQPLQRVAGLRIAHERHATAGKIQRRAVLREGDFHNVGIIEIGGGFEFARQGAHDAFRVGLHPGDELIDHLRTHQRLVALDVQHEVAIVRAGDLGDAVRAGGAIGRGEHGIAAKGLDGFEDAGIFGGDDDLVEAFGFGRLLVDALHERPARDHRQRLPRKPLRAEPRGNDPQRANLHGVPPRFIGRSVADRR